MKARTMDVRRKAGTKALRSGAQPQGAGDPSESLDLDRLHELRFAEEMEAKQAEFARLEEAIPQALGERLFATLKGPAHRFAGWSRDLSRGAILGEFTYKARKVTMAVYLDEHQKAETFVLAARYGNGFTADRDYPYADLSEDVFMDMLWSLLGETGDVAE